MVLVSGLQGAADVAIDTVRASVDDIIRVDSWVVSSSDNTCPDVCSSMSTTCSCSQLGIAAIPKNVGQSHPSRIVVP